MYNFPVTYSNYGANVIVTTGRLESLLRPTLSTIQSKSHCSISLSCELHHELLLAYAQPLKQLKLLNYSKLQMAKAVVYVRAYNTYIHHDSQLCISKYYINMLQEQLSSSHNQK